MDPENRGTSTPQGFDHERNGGSRRGPLLAIRLEVIHETPWIRS